MANPFGRNVIIPLTNQSGGSVAAGDFVYLDTAHNDSFITGTTSAYTGAIGIAQQAIGAGSVGLVLVQGYASLVTVNASVIRGHFGYGYTVAKQATDAGASRIAGTCMMFLTGGTTPDAIIWQPDLGAGSGLVDPMTTRSDIIVRNASNVTARLAVGATANMALRSDGTDVGYAILPGTLLGYHADTSQSPAHTTSGTSLADVDATNAAVTFTAPASTNVLVRLSCTAAVGTTANASVSFGLREGASDIAGAAGESIAVRTTSTVDTYMGVTKVFVLTGISAGSHTYKWSWCVSTGTAGATMKAETSSPAVMEVIAL